MPNLFIRLLVRIGFVSVSRDGALHWPFYVWPRSHWRYIVRHEPLVGVFRNQPGVVSRVPGRLLPWRWGFRFLIVEVGDRGSHHFDPSAL